MVPHTPLQHFLIRGSGSEWGFALLDHRGEVLLRSGPHASRAFALAATEELLGRLDDDGAFERYASAAGRHSFRVRGTDGRRLAFGGHYSTAARRDEMIAACRGAERGRHGRADEPTSAGVLTAAAIGGAP